MMQSSDSDALRDVFRERIRFASPDAAMSAVPPLQLPETAPAPFESFCADSLQRIADRLREALRCDAVAIRLLDRSKKLHYSASSGRSFEPDTISGNDHRGRPRCVCDQVCLADFDRELACFTNSGSFVINSMTDSLTIRRRDSAPRFAHLLNGQSEFQSLVIAPIRTAEAALGVVQCADTRPNHFDSCAIGLIEAVVDELARDIYYDSLWQQRPASSSGAESRMPVACPICGRERDCNGNWRTESIGARPTRNHHSARRVVCPSCLRLCNFE